MLTAKQFSLVCALILLPAPTTFAQGPGPAAALAEGTVVSGVTIDGPQAPVAPATMTRDSDGRVTIRAVRLTTPLDVDGRLDEELYRTVPPVDGFVQINPNPGEPATEATEVWIFFDEDTLYVSARCWDSQPENRWVANEMRRDSMNVVRNENIAIYFDTFYDRRNAFLFEVSPIGGIYDAHITNERAGGNIDWNPVWERPVGRFEGGWTTEMAIPFRSLRYGPGRSQVWGINIRRVVRWKNEESFVVRMPPTQGSAIFQVSQGATLVGLEVPAGSRNLEIKPYAISSLTSDLRATPVVNDELDGDLGFDVKYGVTQNLTADFTYNTDFAQVEVDEQQVNLTRFSLFFPEKREFFLEGQGIFEFGGAGGGGNTPLLFFSRRIGLNGNLSVPIDAGGRLTGKVGPFTIGLMSVRTGADERTKTPATTFSVVRLRRDILRRSSVGVLFTSRSDSVLSPGTGSAAYGADAQFGFFDYLTINAYMAKAGRAGVEGDDLSHRAQLNYNADRYGVTLEHIAVGDNFNPEVGFLRRDDYRRSFGSFRFSPRPAAMPSIRRFSYDVSFDYLTDMEGTLETRESSASFSIEFANSDRVSVSGSHIYEYLDAPFPIADGVSIPIGVYEFPEAQASLSLGNQRRAAGTISVGYGQFYSGHRTTAGFGGGRIELSPRFSVEPGTSINWVDLAEGQFTTVTLTNRATFTVTPLMFFSGLVQFNSSNDSVSTNLRLRWEYQPGSELFVVYTDERDTLRSGYPDLRNRAFVVKVNRLLRF